MWMHLIACVSTTFSDNPIWYNRLWVKRLWINRL